MYLGLLLGFSRLLHDGITVQTMFVTGTQHFWITYVLWDSELGKLD